MLESFLVLTRTGLLLWATEPPAPPILDATAALIREQVLPERGAAAAAAAAAPFAAGAFTLRCAQHSDQLLFIAVAFTQTLAHAAYAEPLLAQVRERWLALYGARARAAGAPLVAQGWEAGCEERAGWSALAAADAAGGASFAAGFAGVYEDLREAAESAQESRRSSSGGGGGGSSSSSSSGGGGGGAAPQQNPAVKAPAEAAAAATPTAAAAAPASPGRGLTPIEKARLAAAQKKAQPQQAKGAAAPSSAPRTWGDDFKYSAKAASELDCSKKTPTSSSSGGGGGGGGSSSGGDSGAGSASPALEFSAAQRALAGADLLPSSAAASAAGAAGAAPEPAGAPSWFSRASTWLTSALGASVTLTPEHLAPVCAQLKTMLIERNVSEGVAEVLTGACAARLAGSVLEGSSTSSLSARLFARVSEALRDSLERVLCPTEPLDLLRDCAAKREAQRGLPLAARAPYVVVFCGVNGVGKSTTLAKVAFMLREGGSRVLIAACDSFRSGAVEQLKKHCGALGVELYEQGYQKDPAEIARAGIRRAVEGGADVVLVDTAGRMQNNTQLMKQLARLVGVNRPDMVLFVGEALVGGDGVDQLREFDRALVDHGDAGAPRGIDGIVLTKFDTVDDKVGAALSMVHACNIPIAYLGVGQSYTDIRRLNVGAVLASLLAQ